MKFENVFSLLEEITIKNSEKISLGIKTSLGWNEFSYAGLGLLARRLACHLINDLKIEKGEKAAILSESRPELGACVFGSALAGMIIVPLDNKLTIYELTSILSDCKPTILLVSAANYEKAMELKNTIPSIKHVILMENTKVEDNIETLYSIPKVYQAKWVRRPLNDTVFIIYTSGTTGSPKGVQITFKNMLAQMHDLKIVFEKILPQMENVRGLSILPMNHLFELTVGFFIFLNMGFSIYYAKSLKPKDILQAMAEKKIYFMITVPAFLKLLKSYIEAELSKQSSAKQKMFKMNYELAKYMPLSVKKAMFKDIHNMFGGEFYGFLSGGAPLDKAVGDFFNRIGVNIFQGYGLSEASPVVSIDYGKDRDIKSVGPALSSIEAKIEKETGELMVKGPSVMKGYYHRDDLTAEAITNDGWLHTGDIAKIDPKTGRIYITGRIKNMIVLSGGKKVFPEEVEAVLEKSPYFADVCVMGMQKTFGEKDGCEGIVAVIVPTKDFISKYNDFKEAEAAVVKEVKALSKRLANYKRPVNIIVREENLPRTSTNKISRKEVKQILTAMV